MGMIFKFISIPVFYSGIPALCFGVYFLFFISITIKRKNKKYAGCLY